jgi:hypothetical protein
MKKYILIFSFLVTLLGCQPEYTNAPGFCALVLIDSPRLTERARKEFEEGKITEQQFNDRLRQIEDSNLSLCLLALIKRKQNGNF